MADRSKPEGRAAELHHASHSLSPSWFELFAPAAAARPGMGQASQLPIDVKGALVV